MAKQFDLQAELGKILTEYGDAVANDVKEATKKVAKAGVKAVKTNAKGDFGGTGKYAKGWTSQVETDQYSAQGFIYNKDVPGLPHLLEHGHAKRGGGRVAGTIHIKPVEDDIIKSFEEAIKKSV